MKELAQFDSLKAEVTLFVQPTFQIRVVDPSSSQGAIDVAKQIKTYLNKVEQQRKDLVAPLNERVKLINDYVKGLALPLQDAERHVKNELSAYAAQQEVIRMEALKKAEEERREAERKAEEERQQEEAEIRAKHEAELEAQREAAALFGSEDESAIQEKEEQAQRELLELEARHERKKIELIVDQKAKIYDAGQSQIKNTRKNWKCEATDLSKVPREFLVITLNTAAVVAAARAGVKEIPGVRIWQEMSVAIGEKTRMPIAGGSNG